MPSQDPTPREGPPIPAAGHTDATSEIGQVPPTRAPDPLWEPTGGQRADAERGAISRGNPSSRTEPARVSYGHASVPPNVAPPTAMMPSAEVPRTAFAPVAPRQHQVLYEPRPSYEVPVAVEQPLVVPPRRKPLWPWVLAVCAVVLGALVGWMIARSDDDDIVTDATPTTAAVETTQVGGAVTDDLGQRLDAALERARADGAYTETGIAQLDEIVEIDRVKTAESLQGQVDLLSVAQEQSVARITELEDEVATLEKSLADVTAERDELKADAGTGTPSMSDTEFLSRLQEKEDRISSLEDQLATASTQLTDAQTSAQKAADDLRVAQSQLQSASATLQALDPKTIPSYLNSDIGRVRADAAANGWILVEQQVDTANSAPGAVTMQQPPAGETVTRGSVIYVEFDKP